MLVFVVVLVVIVMAVLVAGGRAGLMTFVARSATEGGNEPSGPCGVAGVAVAVGGE